MYYVHYVLLLFIRCLFYRLLKLLYASLFAVGGGACSSLDYRQLGGTTCQQQWYTRSWVDDHYVMYDILWVYNTSLMWVEEPSLHHKMFVPAGPTLGTTYGTAYGQFSKCHVCFCGLDSGNLKSETVRTNKQHLFLGFETLNLKFAIWNYENWPYLVFRRIQYLVLSI